MAQPLDPKTLENAYHEAGHAVMAYIAGCVLTGISLSADGGHAPLSSRFRRSRPDIRSFTAAIRSTMEAECMTALAGGAAQQRFSGRRPLPHGIEDDHQIVYEEKLHRVIPRPAEQRACARYLSERVRSELLLDSRAWYAVHRVAHELARKRRLSWRRVRAVVADAMASEDAWNLGRRRRLTVLHP